MPKILLQGFLLLLIISIFSCVDLGNDSSTGDDAAGATDGAQTAPDSAGNATAAVPGGGAITGAVASGDLAGTVIDPRFNTPIAGVTVKITLPNGQPSGIAPAVSNSLGKFEFTSINDIDYLLTLEDPNFITTEAWTTVTDGQLTTLPPVWFIPQPVVTKGTVCGNIYDALTGDLIPFTTIKFRAGINPPTTEPVLYTVSTGIFGYYSLANMEAGVYTGFATHSGYMDGTFVVYVLGGRESCDQNGALSPIIDTEAMRIILQWGATPLDLDSHLWAYHNGCDSPNPFHLYFTTRGSHGCTQYFDLDLDDVTSYGPETTTINETLDGQSPRINQPYRFAVHDYTNRGAGNSTAMSNSPGLRVDVITATGQQTFFMPPNTGATVWSVFDATFDGTAWTIAPRNIYYYQSNPALVN